MHFSFVLPYNTIGNMMILRFFTLLIFSLPLHSMDFNLKNVVDGLSKPWSMSFINSTELIITQKSGELLHLNLKNNLLSPINHNLNILVHGQGGLLDVLFHDGYIYVSFSENRGKKTSHQCACKYNPKNDI